MGKKKHWHEKERDRQARVRARMGVEASVVEEEVGPLREEGAGERSYSVSRSVKRELDRGTKTVELSCGHRRHYRSKWGPPEWMACRVCTEKAQEAARKAKIRRLLEKMGGG